MLVFLKSPTVLAKTIALLKDSPPHRAGRRDAANLAELAARNPNFGNAVVASRRRIRPTRRKSPTSFRCAICATAGRARPAHVLFHLAARRASRNKAATASRSFWITSSKKPTTTPPMPIVSSVDAAGLHKPYKAPELPAPGRAGPGVHGRRVGRLLGRPARPAAISPPARRAFAAARCVVCHRFDGDGGATGPDLTQAAGRFNLRDLSESIVDPSKVVSDQYRATVIQTESGQQFIGRVIGENSDAITLLTDPEDSTKWVQIPKSRNRIAHACRPPR